MVPKMACIINLTAAKNHYNNEVFTDANIHYEKVSCAGQEILNEAPVTR